MKSYLHVILSFILIFGMVSCIQENPDPSNGDFEYSRPGAENMYEENLLQLDKDIKSSKFGDVHSLIILKEGKIIFEQYYNNHSRNELHALGAATMSVVSAIVGTIYMVKDSVNLHTKIIDLFPEYSQYFEDIPQKDKIEIAHLLSNTSGLWWDEWTAPFGSTDNDAYVMSISDNWIEQVLSTPMIREPGFEFNFNSGNAILMAPIIEKLTSENLEEYAAKQLFHPLNITEWYWEKIPGGYPNASWGLRLKAIDMAKIGNLFVSGGKWNGQQIFPESWINISTRRRATITGYYDFAYQWWRFSSNADVLRTLQEKNVFFAWGEGGQFIFVVPDIHMVVVTTAGNSNSLETDMYNMLRDYIFPAIRPNFFN